jgi:hypothetical protein
MEHWASAQHKANKAAHTAAARDNVDYSLPPVEHHDLIMAT